MATVYVVTSGDYSAYGICGVYDDRELAELMRKRCHDAQIEEYELNEGAPMLRSGDDVWHVTFRLDGEIDHVQAWGGFAVHGDPVYETESDGRPSYQILAVKVIAHDEDHAKKIAQDKRAEYLATKAGVT